MAASEGVFLENFPVMSLFAHLVTLAFDFLRFEPKVGFALFGTELHEVVEAFIKSAGVGGFVARI